MQLPSALRSLWRALALEPRSDRALRGRAGSDEQAPPPTTVTLVLGGGGARGLAHIGVIRWLLEHGYQIRSIAGSSMGALVGGIYAADKLEVYAAWVSALQRKDVLRLLDPTLGGDGLFKGLRIMAALRELIGDCEIATLPLAYTAVATDLETGEEVWLREGRLFDVIRASIATPLVFTPFRLAGRTFVDGALVNPLPVAAAHDTSTDLTIAVNLGGPAEQRPAPPPAPVAIDSDAYHRRIAAFVARLRNGRPSAEPSRGMFDVAFASMQTMQDTITRLKLDACAPDICIDIPRNACGYHEFWRAEELIALGHERAARAMAAQLASHTAHALASRRAARRAARQAASGTHSSRPASSRP